MTSTAPKPDRGAKRGTLYIAAGLALFLLGSIGMLLIRYGSGLGIGRPDDPFLAYGIALVASIVGIRMMLTGRKFKTLDAEEILEKGERPIVLYLRCLSLPGQVCRCPHLFRGPP